MAWASVLLVIGGYVLGSMPWGLWLVRIFRGEDIRKVGSGNIGASNVWRVYGRRLGLTRYASVASVTSALSLPLWAWLIGYPWPVVVFAGAAGLGVLLLHRANLR